MPSPETKYVAGRPIISAIEPATAPATEPDIREIAIYVLNIRPMRRFGTVAWKNDITVTSEIDMLRPAMTNSPSARPRLVLILSISIATAKRRGERRRERPIFLPFTIL